MERHTKEQRTLFVAPLTPLWAPGIGDTPVCNTSIFAPSDDLDTVPAEDIRGGIRDVHAASVADEVLVAAHGVRNYSAVCTSTRR